MQPPPSSSSRACAAARCWRFRCPSGRSRRKDWHRAHRNTLARAGRARNGPSRAPLASCGRGRERPVVHVRVTGGVSTEMPSSWHRRSRSIREGACPVVLTMGETRREPSYLKMIELVLEHASVEPINAHLPALPANRVVLHGHADWALRMRAVCTHTHTCTYARMSHTCSSSV